MSRAVHGWLRVAAQLTMVAGAVLPALAWSDGEDGGSCQVQTSSGFPGGIWTPGPAIYGAQVDPPGSPTSVTMDDGVALEVHVSYPTDLTTGALARGPFPVLITQTPYLGPPAANHPGDYFVQHGYLFVTASVRGTRNSGGDFLFFSERDAKDGAELVQWAATKLQNSNGKIGLQGGSWAGLNQVYTAVAAGKNSPIKALVPQCMGAEFYRETYFAGGIPTQTAQFPPNLGNAVGNNHGALAFGVALANEVHAGGPRAYYNDFWKLRSPIEYAQHLFDLGIPTLIWSTHHDIYAESSLSLYAYLQNANSKRRLYGPMDVDQEASGRYQVIISQGGHCQFEEQTTGQNIGNNIQLEWFDTWLKGKKTCMANTNQPVHVHELVSNNWVSTSTYPVAPSYKRYYLAAPGVLSPSAPTASGNQNIVWAQPGPGSTLQYDGPVLKKGATLAGPMSASFYASSTKTNLELIASVELVGADGTITPISSGAVLGSLATNDPSRSWVDKKGVPTKPYGAYVADKYLPAGSINKYDFLISPKFAAIPAGSKVRLVVTTQTPSQDENGVFSPPPPNSQCSPVLGTDPCFPTAPQGTSLTGNAVTLYFGPIQRSSLNLPLLKANCFRPQGNTSVPYWQGNAEVEDGGPCQELGDDD